MEEARRPTYDELLEENRLLRFENSQLKIRVADLEVKAARVDELEQQVADLKAQVEKLKKMLFGKKSEKSKKDAEKKAKPDCDCFGNKIIVAEIEAEIKESPIEVRHRRHQEESVPILDALFDLCRECQSEPTILPKSRLGQACAYALNNEAALRRYCADGRLNIDNNISERTLRAVFQEYGVIGRKNRLFFGSPEVAKKSAIIMTVLSSARRHGLNEWEYLVDVLYRLSVGLRGTVFLAWHTPGFVMDAYCPAHVAPTVLVVLHKYFKHVRLAVTNTNACRSRITFGHIYCLDISFPANDNFPFLQNGRRK